MIKRRTAAEIIGFHFGWDMREVSETRYQPTRYASPSIYVIGGSYCAAPANNKPPKAVLGTPWQEIGEWYGRKVFISGVEGNAS